jgi:hypothetical protein
VGCVAATAIPVRWHTAGERRSCAANSTAANTNRTVAGTLINANRKSPENGATHHSPISPLFAGTYQKAQSGTNSVLSRSQWFISGR